MNSETLEAIADNAAAGLGILSSAYAQLFEYKLPGSPKAGTIGRHAPGSVPPGSVHIMDVTARVERLAYFAEQAVCEWTGAAFTPYELWWMGEPNPLVTLSLGSAARGLPLAVPFVGLAVMPLAAQVSREVEIVQRILGASGGAELFEEVCPMCQQPSLVVFQSPDRILCAMPGCPFATTARESAHA